jgi:hypothetical protein
MVFLHFGTGAGGAPWWFSVLLLGAAVWAAVSAGAGWLMAVVPLALPVMASVVVIVPLALAGWWFSLVMWANVAVFALVFFAHRARLAASEVPNYAFKPTLRT